MAENMNVDNEYDRLDPTEAPDAPIEEEAEESGLVQPASTEDADGEDQVLARVNRAPYWRGGRQYRKGETIMVPRYVLEAQTDNPPFLVEATAAE